MDCHILIHDLEQIEKFYSLFAGYLQNDFCFILKLLARKKYWPEGNIKGGQILTTEIIYKNDIIKSIRKLQCDVNAYVDKDNKVIPTSALCLLLDLRPKSCLIAMSETINSRIKGDEQHVYSKFRKILNSTNIGANDFKQVDVDTKDIIVIKEIFRVSRLDQNIIITIETHNGYHLVIKNGNLNNKMLHEFREYHKIEKLDVNGKKYYDYLFTITHNPMVVVPGTYHGGFKSKIVDWNFI